MTATSNPSPNWSESPAPDESVQHEEFSRVIGEIQQRVSRRFGPGRAFHRKQIAGLKGELVIPGHLPEAAAQGLFASPGSYDVLIRLSNGAIAPAADALPDIRGFALSIRGVTGAAALGGETDRQDFLLINLPSLGFHDSADFARIVPLAASGQTALLTGLIKQRGPISGALEAARLTKELSRWFPGFATATFYSAAPVRWGDYAGKVRLLPQQHGWDPRANRDWGADVARRLAEAPLVFSLQVQLYLDEQRTPIEDGLATWSEQDSPWLTVATLNVPQQDPSDEAGQQLAAEVEAASFDPWAALAEHRPLGEIMRARKVAYYASQRARGAHDPGA
ncbi:MAG: catalase [Candidatus Nanopelagicales bacterium]